MIHFVENFHKRRIQHHQEKEKYFAERKIFVILQCETQTSIHIDNMRICMRTRRDQARPPAHEARVAHRLG